MRSDRGSADGRDDFGGDVIPAMLAAGARVYGYRFDGYWQDVGTVHSYWEAQMELLDDHPPLDLYDRDWVIHTRSEERPPARIGADRQRPSQPRQPRLRHRRHGRALGPLARRAGSTRVPSCATA